MLRYLLTQSSVSGKWSWKGVPVADSAGYYFTDLTVASGNSWNLQVVGVDSTGALRLIWQDSRTGKWGWRADLAPNAAPIASVYGYGPYGNLEVICVGVDGLPYLLWQDDTGKWTWQGRFPWYPTSEAAVKLVTGLPRAAHNSGQPERDPVRYGQCPVLGQDVQSEQRGVGRSH
jgi:hypothetical protein